METTVTVDGVGLPGFLDVPERSAGLVIFAHGSGSSRLSGRNRQVAQHLRDGAHATLLFDLLTEEEADDRRKVFDIGLLADRLSGATAWARMQDELTGLPIGYFGASTGAAAALWAAAEAEQDVAAVVSRGGRPDLAKGRLGAVAAPTLLIVGGRDQAVLEMNREASTHLRCPYEIEIVPGATHLFEEPGALAWVSRLADDWFSQHLGVAADATSGAFGRSSHPG